MRPRAWRTARAVLAVAATALAGCGPGGEPGTTPSVTAQGFRIDEVQTGPLGHFRPTKLRVEAPAGIDELRVEERSYEVDLAKSPEPSHFPLFGLPRRVYGRRDVTLDFAPYIDAKIDREGEYAFRVLVRDRADRTAEATLRVAVTAAPTPPEPEASPAPPGASPAPDARTGSFRLERIGRGPVTGGDAFGLTWRTVEPVSVVIRVTAAQGGASKLARLRPEDFADVGSGAALGRALEDARAVESVEIATANDAAAGAVLGVRHHGRSYVLRADHSETSLSEVGTTVTLVGRYRY